MLILDQKKVYKGHETTKVPIGGYGVLAVA